jgi:hypothetical protein
VSRSIKRIDNDYGYLETNAGYIVLKANKRFSKWLLPWLKLCTAKTGYYQQPAKCTPYVISNFDQLLLFIEQLIKHDIEQEFIRDSTDDPWRGLYESKGYNELLTPISDNDKMMAIGKRVREQQRRADAYIYKNLRTRSVNYARSQLRKSNRS